MVRPLIALTVAASVFGTLAAVNEAMAQTQSPQLSRAEMRSLAQVCKTDVETLCAGVQPGGGRIGQCLREKADQVSAPCKNALSEVLAK